jgi:hypothetical protein
VEWTTYFPSQTVLKAIALRNLARDGVELALQHLKVVNGSSAAEGEKVLPGAAISSSTTLSARDVSQPMFDAGASA